MAEQFPPAPIEPLKDQLSGLLAHYYVAATDPKIITVVAHQWLEIIKPLPGLCVQRAILKWLEKPGGIKPRPGDIRQMSIEIFGEVNWDKWQRAKTIAAMTPTFTPQEELKEDVWMPPTAEEKARVADMLARAGFGALPGSVVE